MLTELIIREDFRCLIPPLSQDERQELEDSILEYGCRDALITWNGFLIDGHNRYEICLGNGIAFRTVEMDFASDDDVKVWMIRNQFGRRNLDMYTRTKLAIALKGLFSAKAKENQRGGQGGVLLCQKSDKASIDTKKELAKIAKVSHDTINKVERIEREAPPEIKAALSRQEISINQAHKQVSAIQKAEKKEAKAERKKSDGAGSFSLFCSSISDFEGIEKESIDFIITDPPYPREFLPVYSQLAQFALKYLKPGGSLIAMVGQSYLPEILQSLNIEGLKYQWCLSYLTPGGQAVQLWDRKVNTFWKPLLWFVKGEYTGDWIGDVSKSNVNDNDKEHHYWGQSESGMFDVVNRFTYPGQLICDPFCGGGTTGVVCVESGRNFLGIDCDKASIETSLKRLSGYAG